MQKSKTGSSFGKYISFSKKIFRFRKPTRNDLIYLILSFLVAFFLWVYIASQISPNYEITINGVPVVVDIRGTKADLEYGLSVIPSENDDKLKVNCTIKGNRTAIGGLSRSDIVAYVDFDSTVTNTNGTQVLPIKLRSANGKNFGNYKLSRSTVEVTMDYYETQEFPAKAVYPDLTFDKEIVINPDEITVDPPTVKIYGPRAQLSKIDYVRVYIDENEEITQKKTFTNCTHYELVDAGDAAVSDSAFQVQATGFSVEIPVHYTKTLPVTIDLSNTPKGFNKAEVLKRIRLNANDVFELPGYGENNLTITIETDNPQLKKELDDRETWSIGSVPLYSLSIGSKTDITVKMDEGYVDRSELGTVTVTMDSTGLIADTRKIKNSDIQLMNGSTDYNYTLQSPAGNTLITLIGTKEDLAAIDSADLHASINLMSVPTTQEGTFPRGFTVTLPETATAVWVSPQPRVNITVTVAG